MKKDIRVQFRVTSEDHVRLINIALRDYKVNTLQKMFAIMLEKEIKEKGLSINI